MLRRLLRLILRLLYRVEVRGEWPRPAPERLLVIANHQSLLDAVLLFAFLPWEVVWVVHADIWRQRRFRILVRWFPHVIVEALRPAAVRGILRELEAGRPVVLFPEGRVTVTGGLMKTYESAAFVALATGATVVTVFIDGAIYTPFSRMKAPFPRRLFPRIRLTVVEPRMIARPPVTSRKAQRQAAARQLRALLEEACLASRPRATLFEALADAAALYGRRTQVLDDAQKEGQTYAWLLKASLALSRLIRRIGREGEAVGVLMPNAAPTAALIFGVAAARRVAAVLNFTVGPEGLQSAVAAAAVRTLVTSRAFLERARLAGKLSSLPGIRILYLEDLRAELRLWDKLWLAGWARWFPKRAAARAKPSEPAVILFTSGSEARPKGVVLSHDALLANLAQVRAVVEISNRYRFLTVLPLFHSFGLTCGLLVPLLNGCRTVLYPSPLHYRTIPELAYGRDASVLLGTPTFLARYGALAHPYDFYNMRYVIAGAERLPEDVRRLWLDKFGIRILEGYGATECAPVVAVNTPFAYKPGSVGRPLPGMECRIVPVPGIARGGELHVCGPNLMLGHLRPERPGRLEPPTSSLGSGWYATGDVAEMDQDGFLYITGRLRRFVKVAGEMVPLELAERLAAEASPRAPSAAVARTEAGRGESIVLFTADPGLRREALFEAARRLGVTELAVARRIEYLAEIPRLATGKFDYVRLKGLAEQLR